MFYRIEVWKISEKGSREDSFKGNKKNLVVMYCLLFIYYFFLEIYYRLDIVVYRLDFVIYRF